MGVRTNNHNPNQMKSTTINAALALGGVLLHASCVEVRDPVPSTSTVTTTTYRPGYVVETLPSGYETRVVRGTTYYTYGDTYFRPASSGYVVVDLP
jgi:hypothetical protein